MREPFVKYEKTEVKKPSKYKKKREKALKKRIDKDVKKSFKQALYDYKRGNKYTYVMQSPAIIKNKVMVKLNEKGINVEAYYKDGCWYKLVFG